MTTAMLCDDLADESRPKDPRLYSVSIYFVTLEYGGPEEGGWWYDAGEPSSEYAQFTRVFRREAPARDYRARLERVLIRRLNKGRRDYRSVLGAGEYRACLDDGLPRAFPAERPHYE